MEKVGPPTGLQSLATGLSLIRMDRVHPLQGFTAHLSVSVRDKVYLPVDLQSFTGGISFILKDQAYPLLSLSVGTSVAQMGKLYPPAGLRSLTGGCRIMAACGRRLLDAHRERNAFPDSADAFGGASSSLISRVFIARGAVDVGVRSTPM